MILIYIILWIVIGLAVMYIMDRFFQKDQSKPPAILFHGTSLENYKEIRKEGLLSMKRDWVHLSDDTDTATIVGSRHGDPIVLMIDTSQMIHMGYRFYLPKNGVWLTRTIPIEYIGVL